jgi:hypothetical protein
MKLDDYGRAILSEDEVVAQLYRTPDIDLSSLELRGSLHNQAVATNYSNLCKIKDFENLTIDPAAWHAANHDKWLMPDEYKQLDIAKWVLEQCTCDAELQRCGEELLEFATRDLLLMLNYCKYLVDTMRKHNIVWGVGRGSSVASFVLFKLGLHKVNSLYYDLDFREFLK